MNVMRTRRASRGIRSSLLLLFLAASAAFAPAADEPSGTRDEPRQTLAAADVMRRLAAEYGTRDKKYAALVEEVAQAVESALDEATWTSGPGEGTARAMREHPHLALVASLSAAARDAAQGRRNPPEREALIEEYPWNSQLELPLGLEYGSERPVPKHKNGFVELGAGPTPFPGYPDLTVNQYLYGLGEIAGWRTGCKKGKASYDGRKPRALALLETELPAWEALRVYLSGSVPDVPLLAIPQLTHRIHARLAERRREGAEELPRMDALLALLDSKWNGFTFETPYTKGPVACVMPIHALLTDTRGFLNQFPASEPMARIGDLPFVSIQTHEQYSLVFRGKRVGASDYIAGSPKALESLGQFDREVEYLSRYRTLIDLIVRAVLSPESRYPSYLALYDLPEGRPPSERGTGAESDVTRRHALLLWAYVDKDPEALADWLQDELLSKEGNSFPERVSLPVAFLQLVREKESEMVAAVAERAGEGGDLAREFSPFATYLTAGGTPHGGYLLDSFHGFHAQVEAAVQAAAYAVVLRELGEQR